MYCTIYVRPYSLGITITAFFPSPPDCVHKINAIWGFPGRVSTVCV